MFIATIILAVETPLGDYVLAGQSGAVFLEKAAAQLGPHIADVGRDAISTYELEPQLRAWLDDGIQRVLLVRGDRPLLTAETLGQLMLDQRAPLVTLAAPDGTLPAGCAEARWLWEQLESAADPLTLEKLAQMADAPLLDPTNPAECLAVNSLPALAEAERIVRQRINLGWMQAGVQMVDPATTYIHAAVTIGRGTLVLPNTHLWGQTAVGESCRIGPNTIVRDSEIGNHCIITASVVEEAVMEDESDIGPFGHLRKGARVCRGAHIGNFGEMKNSTLGPNAKMGHFSYLGDATVGENVNIGAGTITCNYDGVNKHKTVIQEGAFIGSDVMLVAPVEIGAGASIGAGSVVTHDVPAGAVAYGVPARVQRSSKEEKGEDSGPSK